MQRLIFILGFLLSVLYSPAQIKNITITGIVTDKETNSALAGVTVFINNTTYSTQTDTQGQFSLLVPVTTTELTFTSVNYETQVIAINKPQGPLTVTMQKKAVTMAEVIIKTPVDKNAWAKYGATFIKDFLSYSSFTKQCEIINYQSIRFSINKKDNILKAYATEPLRIKNNALGYEITYWLEEYEHRFAQQLLLFKGYTQFAKMRGKDKQQLRWFKNRQLAYKGSLTHFLRSVYNSNTTKEGFVVNKIKTINYQELNFYIPKTTDSTSVTNTGSLKNFISGIYGTSIDNNRLISIHNKAAQWLKSSSSAIPFYFTVHVQNSGYSTFYFLKNPLDKSKTYIYRFDVTELKDTSKIHWQTAGKFIADNKMVQKINGFTNMSTEQKNTQKIKLFYNAPIDPQDYIIRKNGTVYFHFNDSWQITYQHEKMDKEYIKENALSQQESKFQQSILSFADAQPVVLFPNGYYSGTYSLVTGAYWSYEKTDKLLPLDYSPD